MVLLATYLPPESGLGDTEHSQVCKAVLDVAGPPPANKRRACGNTPTILLQNMPKLEGMP